MCREHYGRRITSPTFLRVPDFLKIHLAFGNQKIKFAIRRNWYIRRPLKNSKLFTFQRLENQLDFVGKVLLLIFYYRYRESVFPLTEF